VKKTTIKQRRELRQKKTAETAHEGPKGGSQLQQLVQQINKDLGGIGRIHMGADIEKEQWERRGTGIPSLDYVLNGGLPKGGLIEFGGQYSSGKTTVSLHLAAKLQREVPGKAIGWTALEPFSKRWARENGLWIPFSKTTGDPVEKASALERYRMEQAGIKDPYKRNGLAEVVLVQEERGDVALDATLKLLRSNMFSLIVVDSLGVARSTKWLEEAEVQDSDDFSREPKMISNYTTRALLALNARYDDNNVKSANGTHRLETTLIHINQVTTAIGTMAHSPWKQYSIKGGEGNKHNHHAIIFFWRGQPMQIENPAPGSKGQYVYGSTVNLIGLKSKLGPPFLQGEFDLYTQDYGTMHAGDVDVAKDAVAFGLMSGIIGRAGAWFTVGEQRLQGREALTEYFRENPEWLTWLLTEAFSRLRKD